MITTVISSIVILVACTIGAIVGFGGGVIIKPVLDGMGFCTIDIVNFVSSCAVLAMSCSSIIRHVKQKTEFDKKLAILVSFGAVAGGFCGNRLFSLVISLVDNSVIKAIQAIMIIIFVMLALYVTNKKNPKTLNLSNPIFVVLSGVMLGTLNSFLGIGGGPINIMVLLLFFSLQVKKSAVYSICIVFFCQLTNLLTLFATNHFAPYKDYYLLAICAVVAAVLGGLIGSTLNKKFSEKLIKIIFDLVMVFVFCINAYNFVMVFVS